MKALIFGLLAALFGLLSVIGGLAVGFGGIAYGIWTIIAAYQSATISFWIVFKAVLFLAGSGLLGWLTFFILAFIASFCGVAAKDASRW